MNGRRAPDHVTEDYRTVLLISIPPATPRSTYLLTPTGRLLAAPFNAATTGVVFLFSSLRFVSLLFSPRQGRETLTPVQLDVLYANSPPKATPAVKEIVIGTSGTPPDDLRVRRNSWGNLAKLRAATNHFELDCGHVLGE